MVCAGPGPGTLVGTMLQSHGHGALTCFGLVLTCTPLTTVSLEGFLEGGLDPLGDGAADPLGVGAADPLGVGAADALGDGDVDPLGVVGFDPFGDVLVDILTKILKLLAQVSH